MSDTTNRLWRTLAAATLAGALALGGTACTSDNEGGSSAGNTTNNAAEGEWPRTIDTDGGDLTLEAKPERIVSTSVTLTGSLLAVDAPVVASGATGENIEGVTDENGFFVQWSNEAKKNDVKQLWSNSAPEVENIVDYNPDLIVVSRTGGDSAYDQIDEIRKIAPVLVVNYSGSSWQDVTKTIGEATGNEEQAEAAIADFDARVAEVKDKIELPEGTVSPLMVYGDGSGAGALTEVSPQVQLLKDLGFTIAEVPDEVKGSDALEDERKDMVDLSLENIQKGLPGDLWIVVGADEMTMEQLRDNKAFSEARQVKDGDYITTPSDTFRFDYFSALSFLDSIEEQFSK